jgi:hypothetical protein
MVAKLNSKTHLQKNLSCFQLFRLRLNLMFVKSAIEIKIIQKSYMGIKNAEFDADFELL